LKNTNRTNNWFWFILISELIIWQIGAIYIGFIKPLLTHTAIAFICSNSVSIIDFVIYYAAGRIAISSDSHRIYDPQIQLSWTNKLIAPLHIDHAFYFQYGPHILPLLIPLALFSLETAYVIWACLGLLFGIFGSIVLLKYLGWTRRETALFVLALVPSLPSILALKEGQLSWYFIGFITLYIWCLIKSRNILAGFILALMSVKPHYSIFFALPALAYKRWHLIISFIVVELILFLIAGNYVGWENIWSYPAVIRAAEINSNYMGVAAENMVCIRALLIQYLTPALALKLSLLATALSVIFVSILWLIAKKNDNIASPLALWTMTITVIACLTFSAHAHIHDTLLLAVPAMLTLNVRNSRGNPLSGWLYNWQWLFITFPFTSWLLLWAAEASNIFKISFFAFLMILFICALWQYKKLFATSFPYHI